MNLYEFLQQPELQLPLERDTEDFLAFAQSTLNTYLNLLDELEAPKTVVDEINNHLEGISTFCTVLKEVVRTALNGRPFEAYKTFSEGIVSFPTSFLDRLSAALTTPKQLGTLFRVRRYLAPNLKREDLFHVPFESRHKVASQRYSVPGLPCLYLSGSLYTCWCEMGRPPFHELQLAAFWLKDGASIRVVNFSERPKRLQRRLTPDGDLQNPEDKDMLVAHLALWPLMALCSIVAKHRDGPFKPEYLVPQNLLQWISERGEYDGVCYFSTHVAEVVTPAPMPACNLVFPTRDIRPAGRCSRLRNIFKMTEPVSWELLRAIRIGLHEGLTPIGDFKFAFVPGAIEHYGHTEFGVLEKKLTLLEIEAKRKIARGDTKAGDVAD